jgi:glycosyltransferase involved in cell wall biosynthesis
MKIAVLTTDNREHDRNYQAARPYFGTAPEALLQGLATLPGLEVHVISCTQQPVSSPAKLADNTWFHSLHVPKTGWMRTGYQGCIRATRRKLKEIQPDIVHGQGTERDCAISAVFGGFPSVVTIHGNMNAIARLHHAKIGSFHWLAARLEDFTLPRTGGIICISDYVKNLVEKYRAQTWIVPNAIQKTFFDFPRTEVIQPERPLIVNVGVISPRKRQQELLAVLEPLRGQKLEFDTVFVGVSDPATAYAQEFDAQLAAADQRYGGFAHVPKLDAAAICRLLDHASAMIHFANEETFGLTFAEAIARGLHLFASDVGAVRKIAQGVAGVEIFAPDDWDGMQAAVQKWLLSDESRKPHPQKPPPEFVQAFHPVSVAKRHLEIYRAVLKTAS